MDKPALCLAFFSAILMGTIGVFSKITGLPAEIITFFRLTIGALFMLVFMALTGKAALAGRRPSLAVIVNGFFLAGFIIFYVQAMNFTSMANAIMLVYLAPLAASLVAHFFMNERLTALSVGLIGMALFGFAMMMEFRLELSRQSSEFIGISLGCAALVCYAGFILVNRLIPKRDHVYTRTFYQLLTGGLVMLPLVIGSMDRVGWEHVPWLLATGLLPGFLAILFAVVALSRLDAATFGTIAYVEPVAVVVFGWTIFNETLSPLQIGGCLLIIASGVLKTLSSARANGRRVSAPSAAGTS